MLRINQFIDFMQLLSSVVAELKPFTSKEGKYYYSSMWDNGVIHNSDSLYSFPLSAFAELEKFSCNTTFKNTFITKEINKYYYLKNNYRSYFPSFTNEFSGEKNAMIRNFLVASNDFL